MNIRSMEITKSRKSQSPWMPKFNNQKGSTIFPFLFFILAFAGIGILFLFSTLNAEKLLVNQLQSYRCIQKFHIQLKDHANEIEKINALILMAKASSNVLILIPGMQSAGLTTAKIKKALKYFQIALVVSHQKKVFDLINLGCPILPNLIKSPYTHWGVKINRNAKELAIIRKKKWSQLYFLPLKRILKINYQFQNGRIKMHSRAIL